MKSWSAQISCCVRQALMALQCGLISCFFNLLCLRLFFASNLLSLFCDQMSHSSFGCFRIGSWRYQVGSAPPWGMPTYLNMSLPPVLSWSCRAHLAWHGAQANKLSWEKECISLGSVLSLAWLWGLGFWFGWYPAGSSVWAERPCPCFPNTAQNYPQWNKGCVGLLCPPVKHCHFRGQLGGDSQE